MLFMGWTKQAAKSWVKRLQQNEKWEGGYVHTKEKNTLIGMKKKLIHTHFDWDWSLLLFTRQCWHHVATSFSLPCTKIFLKNLCSFSASF